MKVLDILRELGSVHDRGEYLHIASDTGDTNGRHEKFLTAYVDCDPLMSDSEATGEVVKGLADSLAGIDFDTIVCAAVGDIVFAAELRCHLRAQGVNVDLAFAEKGKVKGDDKALKFDRASFPEAVAGARVVVVNDRISNGGTTRRLIRETEAAGGLVLGITCISAPSHMDAETFNVDFFNTLAVVDVDVYLINDVPEELRRLPIAVGPGHGQDFVDEGGTWPSGFYRVASDIMFC